MRTGLLRLMGMHKKSTLMQTELFVSTWLVVFCNTFTVIIKHGVSVLLVIHIPCMWRPQGREAIAAAQTLYIAICSIFDNVFCPEFAQILLCSRECLHNPTLHRFEGHLSRFRSSNSLMRTSGVDAWLTNCQKTSQCILIQDYHPTASQIVQWPAD